MDRLEYLSRFSNAVLSPELNTHTGPLKSQSNAHAYIFNIGEVSQAEKIWRTEWCKRQLSLIGEFGAVLGG